MATNLFKRAAQYRKSHPSVSQAEAVKLLSKKDKKSPARKKAARKKPAAKKKAAPRKKAAVKKAVGKVRKARPAAPRKVKIKVKPGKKGVVNLGISGVSHTKIGHELQHIRSLELAMNKHRELLKAKGLKATEKAAIRRDIAKYRNNISAAKKHISALKRSL